MNQSDNISFILLFIAIITLAVLTILQAFDIDNLRDRVDELENMLIISSIPY